VSPESSLWSKAVSELKATLPAGAWQAWFASAYCLSESANEVCLAVPNSLAKERLEQRYRELIHNILTELAGRPLELRLVVANDRSTDDSVNPFQPPRPPDPTTPTPVAGEATENPSNLNPRYNFTAFVTGSSNRFAAAAALSVAEMPAKSYNPLFIHGAAGLGKTHLLHAIGNYVTQHYGQFVVRYISTETFLNEFIDAIRTNSQTQFKRRYRTIDVLLVDDIQFIENKESMQEEFFHTFNTLYEASKQIVISSDRHPRSLATLEDRLRSRFLSGLITDIQPPDIETRMAILSKKSEIQQIPIPDEVLFYIASNVLDNIRALEGALIRCIAYANLMHSPVTMALAEEALVDLTSTPQGPSVTPQRILELTASEFAFTVNDLIGPSRRRPLVLARQIGMYLFRELTDYSYPAIARVFGNRDHTTVIYAVDKISRSMPTDRKIYDQVTRLINQVKSGG
jgi:chromosomal replication initiator protein